MDFAIHISQSDALWKKKYLLMLQVEANECIFSERNRHTIPLSYFMLLVTKPPRVSAGGGLVTFHSSAPTAILLNNISRQGDVRSIRWDVFRIYRHTGGFQLSGLLIHHREFIL